MGKTYYIPSLMDTADREPMDLKTSEVFLQAGMMEQVREPEEFNERHAAECGAVGRILYQRLQLYGGKVSVGTAILCCMLSKGSPGNLVMYAFTLARMYKSDKKLVNTGHLASVFPWGFPNEKGLSEVWDAQKGKNWGEPVDNMLDHPDILSDVTDEEQKQEWGKWIKNTENK